MLASTTCWAMLPTTSPAISGIDFVTSHVQNIFAVTVSSAGLSDSPWTWEQYPQQKLGR